MTLRMGALPASMLCLAGFAVGCRTTTPDFGNRSGSRIMDDQSGGGEAGAFPVQPTSAMNIVAQIQVGGDWMCIGFGNLWEPSGGKLARVNPENHEIITKIAASGNFCHPAPDEQVMWLASVFDGKLHKIDATNNTVIATYTVPITSGSEGSFAVTQGGVWVITNNGQTSSGTLTRVDPANGQVLANIKVKDDSHGIAVGGGFVWVTSSSDNSVTKVDPATNTVVATVPTGEAPRFIAGSDTDVWVLNQGPGTVTRVNAASGEVAATIDTQTPGGGGGITYGEGAAWVTTFGAPVTRIDPATNKVTVKYEGNGFGDAIVAGAGYVWVSGGKLSQIKPDAPTPPPVVDPTPPVEPGQ